MAHCASEPRCLCRKWHSAIAECARSTQVCTNTSSAGRACIRARQAGNAALCPDLLTLLTALTLVHQCASTHRCSCAHVRPGPHSLHVCRSSERSMPCQLLKRSATLAQMHELTLWHPHAGQPCVVWAQCPQLEWTRGSEPKYWDSSEYARRGFCSACGTPLTYEPHGRVPGVAAGAFDHPGAPDLRPVKQWGALQRKPGPCS